MLDSYKMNIGLNMTIDESDAATIQLKVNDSDKVSFELTESAKDLDTALSQILDSAMNQIVLAQMTEEEEEEKQEPLTEYESTLLDEIAELKAQNERLARRIAEMTKNVEPKKTPTPKPAPRKYHNTRELTEDLFSMIDELNHWF